jgi:hypothetical protein
MCTAPDSFSPKTRKYPSLNRGNFSVEGGVFSGFLAKRVMCGVHDPVFVRIDGTNGRMEPKNQKVVVWRARI